MKSADNGCNIFCLELSQSDPIWKFPGQKSCSLITCIMPTHKKRKNSKDNPGSSFWTNYGFVTIYEQVWHYHIVHTWSIHWWTRPNQYQRKVHGENVKLHKQSQNGNCRRHKIKLIVISDIEATNLWAWDNKIRHISLSLYDCNPVIIHTNQLDMHIYSHIKERKKTLELSQRLKWK